MYIYLCIYVCVCAYEERSFFFIFFEVFFLKKSNCVNYLQRWHKAFQHSVPKSETFFLFFFSFIFFSNS